MKNINAKHTDFKFKKIGRHCYCVMIKESINLEDILSTVCINIIVPKYIKQELTIRKK